MNKFQMLTALALAAGGLPLSSTAEAATRFADLEVLANVDPACTVTTTPVNFGTIDPSQNVAFQATGAIHVTCTSGTGWSATANDGVNPLLAGGGFIRSMEGHTAAIPAHLKYSLFTDAALTKEWRGATAFSGLGTGSQQDVPVYGLVPSNQTAIPPDSYEDTVVVDLEY